MAQRAPEPSATEPSDGPAAPAAVPHDEWLIDQSVMETFPASDPASPFDARDADEAREAGAPPEDRADPSGKASRKGA